jgi:hypothetical protein
VPVDGYCAMATADALRNSIVAATIAILFTVFSS